jgi:uncharacterized membrane protein
MLATASVAAASAAWLAVLLAAPTLPAHLAAIVYAAGSVVCHQIPERSFYRGSIQLPVCARCLGIYVGLAAGALAWCVSPQRGRTARRTSIRVVMVLAALPTVLTVALEGAGAWDASNAFRAGAGVVLGLGLSTVVMWALETRATDATAPSFGKI